jgi:hypothetical protein
VNVTNALETLDADITNLNNSFQTIQFKVTYYEVIDISQGTSGSLTDTPTGATILLGDEFGGSGEAILSTLTPGGSPDLNTPDNNGPVTVDLDGTGAWNTNTTYVDPVALIYKYTISFSNFSNVNLDFVLEFFKDTINSDEVGNLSNVAGADVTTALNNLDTAITNKVSADGSVTTHSDVTDAGSGAIITNAERTKLDGIETNANLYVHPDHTGDVTSTSDGTTVIDPTAITGKQGVIVDAADYVLISDTDDSGNLKRVTTQSIADLVGEVGTVSPLTTKGDLYTYDIDNQRLPVGPNNSILVADSNTSTGLRWETNNPSSYSTTLVASGWIADLGVFYQDIIHPLNSLDIGVEVYDASTNRTIIPEQIERSSVNTIRIIVSDDALNLRVLMWNGIVGVQGPEGIASVTGDGVNNTDPLNPVLSFPTSSQITEDTDNNFVTDADLVTLANTSGVNTGDETDASVKTKYENNLNTNAFTDAEKTKLASLEASTFLGQFISLGALQSVHPSPAVGSYAYVDQGPGQDVVTYVWDSTDSVYVLQTGITTSETPASIKTKYESNADTNEFTDAEKTNLSNQSGTNTGDETTVSIQTKRPLKTVEGQSLEGAGNIDITKADVDLANVDNTSDANKPISDLTQLALDGKKDDFTENTAFNKDFGNVVGTVCEGNDSRLSDARTPTAHTHLSTEITDFQTAVSGNADVSANTTKLAGIEANAKDDQNASEVPFSINGDITATDVQSARY